MNIVTGMHRSGTSFLANLLAVSGADFGDQDRLLEGDDFNAQGYFENIDVMLLNDRTVLGNIGYSVRARLAPSGAPGLHLQKLALAALKSRYLVLHSNVSIQRRGGRRIGEFSALGAQFLGVWAKDPRFSLTLPLWLRSTDVETVVYSFRHPLEVAQSLRQREGIPLWLGLRTWRFHVETFLEDAPLNQVRFIDFNRLRSPEFCEDELQRCAGALGNPAAIALLRTQHARVFQGGLVHHRSGNVDTPLPPDVGHLYDRLRQLHERQCPGNL